MEMIVPNLSLCLSYILMLVNRLCKVEFIQLCIGFIPCKICL